MFKRKKKGKQLAPQRAAASTQQVGQTSVVQAIGQLKGSQGKLEKRVNFLRKKANKHLNQAKKANLEGNKQDALMNLRRKKVFEKEIQALESSIITIEENILRIEGSSAVADVYGALKLAKSIMTKVTKGVNVDDLQDVMADLQDLAADQDEVQDVLGSPVEDSLNDVDLLNELENLGVEQVEESAFKDVQAENNEERQLLKELSQSTRDLQELENLVVPKTKPKIQKKKERKVKTEEEKELEELQAAMLT